MARKDYRCTQYGECDKADNRELIGLEAGEEPVCPECAKPLTTFTERKPPVKLIIGIAGIAVVIVAAILLWPHPSASVEQLLTDVWPWLNSRK